MSIPWRRGEQIISGGRGREGPVWKMGGGRGRKARRNRYVWRLKSSREGQKSEGKYSAAWYGNFCEIQENWDVRDFQDSTAITFTLMPNSGEKEPEETICNQYTGL